MPPIRLEIIAARIVADAWPPSLLTCGPLLEAKGADLTRPAEAPAPGEVISERWAELSRNGR